MKNKNQRLRVFLITFHIMLVFALASPAKVQTAVDPNSIRAQVEKTVEARKDPTSPRFRGVKGDLAPEYLLEEGRQHQSETGWFLAETEIKYSWFGGKILIRNISGQWYLSLGKK